MKTLKGDQTNKQNSIDDKLVHDCLLGAVITALCEM